MIHKIKCLLATHYKYFSSALLVFLLITISFNSYADSANAKVSHPKVITLAPHITELVYAAGAGHTIVGTVRSSNFPKQAKQIHRVGDGLNINVEHLLTLEPDIIYAWHDNLSNQNMIEKTKPFGIEVLFSAPESIQDIPVHIRSIGKKLNTYNEANISATDLENKIKNLQNKYSNKQRLSVFLEIGSKPVYSLGNDDLTNSVVNICGTNNIFADSAAVAPIVNPEQVINADPDIIIITNLSASNLAKRVRYWQKLGLKAALNHNVYTVDPDQMLRPGPRLIDAAQRICNLVDKVRTINTTSTQ